MVKNVLNSEQLTPGVLLKGRQLKIILVRGNAMIFCSIRSSRLSDCHNIVPRAGLFGNTRILGIAILLLVFAVSMVGSQ